LSLQQNPEALDAIAFAERVLSLLDQGAYNTTYKFSVLLGLMDLERIKGVVTNIF
jgi:hypothetical protein